MRSRSTSPTSRSSLTSSRGRVWPDAPGGAAVEPGRAARAAGRRACGAIASSRPSVRRPRAGRRRRRAPHRRAKNAIAIASPSVATTARKTNVGRRIRTRSAVRPAATRARAIASSFIGGVDRVRAELRPLEQSRQAADRRRRRRRPPAGPGRGTRAAPRTARAGAPATASARSICAYAAITALRGSGSARRSAIVRSSASGELGPGGRRRAASEPAGARRRTRRRGEGDAGQDRDDDHRPPVEADGAGRPRPVLGEPGELAHRIVVGTVVIVEVPQQEDRRRR